MVSAALAATPKVAYAGEVSSRPLPARCSAYLIAAATSLLLACPAEAPAPSPAASRAPTPDAITAAPPTTAAPPAQAPAAAPPATTTAAPAIDGLLAELATCAPARCDERVGLLFEAASLLTSRERAFATPPRLQRLCRELLRSLGPAGDDEPPRQEVQVALASLAALAAVIPEVPALLRAQEAPARLHALLQDPPDALSHGRALLILGALQPGAPATQKAATVTAISAGLRAADRTLRRLSALAAALAREEALDPALFQSLRTLLQVPAGDAALATLRAPLPRALAVELNPLLPVYVDLLLSTNQAVHSDAALRLTRAAVAAEPRSGSARFFLAQVLARRGDPAAAAEQARALASGNLPATLAGALAAQPPAGDRAQARARVRQLLQERPPLVPDPSRVTAAALQRGAVRVARVDPAQLEAEAAALGPQPAADAARRVGARLFTSYPFRSDEYYDSCLRSFLRGDNQDLLEALGLSAARDEDGGRSVVGVVQVAGRYGVTCALCHTQVERDGQRVDGAPARAYDQGLLLASCLDQPIHHKSGNRNLDELMDYRPGRNDSTSDAVHNPTEIPSFFGLAVGRAVRWSGDTPTLEVQIDRNLSEHSAPRPVLRALASYLRALPLPRANPAAPGDQAAVAQGQALFQRECERCHSAPAWTSGAIIPVEELGTDRARVAAVLPNSTAGYKVPSLLRITRSAPYLHDGSVPTLERLLDPARCPPPRPGQAPPCEGHRYGHGLPPRSRAALVTYLRTL